MSERTPEEWGSNPKPAYEPEANPVSDSRPEPSGGSGRGVLSPGKSNDEDLRLYGGWWTATWFLDGL